MMDRRSLKIVESVLEIEKFWLFEDDIKEFRNKIANDIIQKCQEMIKVWQIWLSKTKTVEGKVFLWKTLGDFNRYICNAADGKLRSDCVKAALQAYDQASKIGRKMPK